MKRWAENKKKWQENTSKEREENSEMKRSEEKKLKCLKSGGWGRKEREYGEAMEMRRKSKRGNRSGRKCNGRL